MNDGKGWRGQQFIWGRKAPAVGPGQIQKEDTKKAWSLGFGYKLTDVQPLRFHERLKEIALENMDAVQEWEDCRVKMRDWRNCFICPFKDCINDRPKITAKMNRDEMAHIESLLFSLAPDEERIRASKAKYIKNNKEKIAQYQKAYDKKYREEKKDEIDQKKKEYIKKNKDEVAQRKHDWYLKNKERLAMAEKERRKDEEKARRKKETQREWYLRKKAKQAEEKKKRERSQG